MSRGTIYYDDRSGTLVRGLVWQFEIRIPRGQVILYAETAHEDSCRGQEEELRECPVDERHVTGYKVLEIALDTFGKTLRDFVPVWDMGYLVISEGFAKRLRQSPLTGYAIRPIVKIGCNQSRVRDLRLFYLEVTGKGGRDLRWKVEGAPDCCPHCGYGPMLCPGCGQANWPSCLNCDEWTLFNPQAPEYSHPKGFELQPSQTEERIIEGTEWDGSDWFRVHGSPFVSKRAKEWLEATHTFPIAFKPALLNIEGVEERFKDK